MAGAKGATPKVRDLLSRRTLNQHATIDITEGRRNDSCNWRLWLRGERVGMERNNLIYAGRGRRQEYTWGWEQNAMMNGEAIGWMNCCSAAGKTLYGGAEIISLRIDKE